VHDAADNPKRLKCSLCDAILSSYGSLFRHYLDHGVPESILSNSYVGIQASRKKFTTEMTHEEFMACQPCGEWGEDLFACKICDNGKQINVRNALRHFTATHHLDSNIVKDWKVSKDGNAVRNGTRPRQFWEAYDQYVATNLQEAEWGEEWTGHEDQTDWWTSGGGWSYTDDKAVDTEVGGTSQAVAAESPAPGASKKKKQPTTEKHPADKAIAFGPCKTQAELDHFFSTGSASSTSGAAAPPPTDEQPSPSSTAQSMLTAIGQKLGDLQQKLADNQDPSNLGIVVPKVTVKIAAYDWEEPEDKKKRNQCPIAKSLAESFDRLDLGDFMRYLKDNTNQKNATSRNTTVLNLKRFLCFLDWTDEPEITAVGVMCGVYRHDVMYQIMESPMFNPKHSWTHVIANATDHYVNYLMTICNKRGWVKAKTQLQMLQDEALTAMKKKAREGKSAASLAKKFTDAERLSNFPAVSDIKNGVKDAMIVIALINAECHKRAATKVPFRLAKELLTAMVGILFYNSYPGRIGEWSIMLRKHVQEQREAKRTFLVCTEHKTSSTYGSLAKFVPPGTWAAIDLFLEFDIGTGDKFLQPLSAGSDRVCLSYYLARFGFMYLRAADPPNSNLIRKLYHSVLMKEQGRAMELMVKVDAHSKQIAERVYAVRTVADDAELASILFKSLFGEHVKFPTAAEIKKAKLAEFTTAGVAIDDEHEESLKSLDIDQDALADSEWTNFLVANVLAIEDKHAEQVPALMPPS